MKHSYEIVYKNVHLRPLAEDDIENLRIWRNNPQNTKYLNKIPFITPEMQDEWFHNYIENTDEICFAIDENSKLNRLVGSCSLYNFDGESCFFGKILIGDEEAHGQKIGLNATEAAAEIAFLQLKISEIKLLVYTDNIAAIKVYEKAHFHIIDTHQDLYGNKEFSMLRRREEKENA